MWFNIPFISFQSHTWTSLASLYGFVLLYVSASKYTIPFVLTLQVWAYWQQRLTFAFTEHRKFKILRERSSTKVQSKPFKLWISYSSEKHSTMEKPQCVYFAYFIETANLIKSKQYSTWFIQGYCGLASKYAHSVPHFPATIKAALDAAVCFFSFRHHWLGLPTLQ